MFLHDLVTALDAIRKSKINHVHAVNIPDCSMMSFLGVQHYLGFWGLKERQSLTRCCAGKQNKMLGILVTGVAPDFLGCCSFIRVARSSRFGDH